MTVIDAFADKQTVALAAKFVVVGYGECGFDAEGLLEEIDELDLNGFAGCVYGSGFEAQPELLQKIAAFVPLIGNRAETVGAIKSATRFFNELRRLSVRHPEVFDDMPAGDVAYLCKDAGGCGGTHIDFARSREVGLAKGRYYQRHIDGQSVSLLFIANGHDIKVIGFNEQWLSASEVMPFRYGGAVSHVSLLPVVRQQLIDAAQKLTLSFGLLGLNSLDAMVHNDVVYVLEVNPRLSATVDLYSDSSSNLISEHMQACLNLCDDGKAISESKCCIERPKAHAIVYAEYDIEIAPSFAWPEEWGTWVTDTPDWAGKAIKVACGAPVCTVFAYGPNAQEAKALAQHRVRLVQDLIKQYIIK